MKKFKIPNKQNKARIIKQTPDSLKYGGASLVTREDLIRWLGLDKTEEDLDRTDEDLDKWWMDE
ncbi:MAG: hypothetical protein LBO69_05200 [Ignavibacteria bacterium]|jgi:hypothetical protein|nr:hypothetical protein [Ignavibacteria bacterium]